MSTFPSLFTAQGSPVQLGAEIGRGGEGAVYLLPAFPNEVAKLYHKPLSPDRQRKLRVMASGCTDELRRIATWPLATLHAANGAVMGFVMPKAVGFKEIHRLYGPKERRQEFPNAEWTFLVRSARNVAAALARLHRSGYMMGDLNPKNLAVSGQATVMLMDCDSFQVKAGREFFPCRVGVPDFIAPELQGQDLDVVERTPNHDNFTVALMVFHLLFLGRHPFTGVLLDTQESSQLQRMREFRFAYGPGAAARRIQPPPNALAWETLSPAVAQLFERAFSANAVHRGRPTALEWMNALQQFEREMVHCRSNAMHHYPRHNRACPWCRLSSTTGIEFFPAGARASAQPATAPAQPFAPPLDLAQAWTAIAAVAGPGPASLPSGHVPSLSPAALPPDLTAYNGRLDEDVYSEAEVQRKSALAQAEADYQAALAQWNKYADDRPFHEQLAALQQGRERLAGFYRTFGQSVGDIDKNGRALALHAYLERHLLSNAQIPGIGPGRKSLLLSFGIEDAADIEWQALERVPSIGPETRDALFNWRDQITKAFVYQRDQMTGAALAQAMADFESLRTPLEDFLRNGPDLLRTIATQITDNRAVLSPALVAATKQVAQAKLDLADLQEAGERLRSATLKRTIVQEQCRKRRNKLLGTAAATVLAGVLIHAWLANAPNIPAGSATSGRFQIPATPLTHATAPAPASPILFEASTTPLTRATAFSSATPSLGAAATPLMRTTASISAIPVFFDPPISAIVRANVQVTIIYSIPDRLSEPTVFVEGAQSLAVLERTEDRAWLRVRTLAGQEGWVRSIVLAPAIEQSTVPYRRFGAIVQAEDRPIPAFTRPADPLADLALWIHLPLRVEVKAQTQDSTWFLIQTPSGRKGWLPAAAVNLP